MLTATKKFLLDMIFPPICLVCEKETATNLCQDCLSSIQIKDYLHCPVCFSRSYLGKTYEDTCHPRARYSLASAADYNDETLKKIIWQFKYESWQSLARPLAGILISHLEKIGVTPQSDWLLVPVPLHATRQRKRSFNQSALLAEEVSLRMSLPWLEDNLIRVKNTDSQMELANFQEREDNLANAFFVNNPEEFKRKNIILVDDVFTSGATLDEAARVLKLAGAKKIIALVIAQAR